MMIKENQFMHNEHEHHTRQHAEHHDPLSTTTHYCVRCKKKQHIKNPTEETTKNGKKALTGTCEVCGTKMFAIIAQHAKVEKPS